MGFKTKNKATQEVCAAKTIAKAKIMNKSKEETRLKQEVDIARMVDHPNVIKYYETFEDCQHFYLITELCTGGDLFERIVEAGHFTEVQSATVMQQIMHVTSYLHNSHICHRDIKPENFLFATRGPVENCHLKLIDFGNACSFREGELMTTKAGTPYYVAPEVLRGQYDHLSDIWSCGVIMYVLLCGYPPFYGETDAEVLLRVRKGNFSFNSTDWRGVSEDAKNLIRWMFKLNPRDRPSAAQMLIWISTWSRNTQRVEKGKPRGKLVD